MALWPGWLSVDCVWQRWYHWPLPPEVQQRVFPVSYWSSMRWRNMKPQPHARRKQCSCRTNSWPSPAAPSSPWLSLSIFPYLCRFWSNILWSSSLTSIIWGSWPIITSPTALKTSCWTRTMSAWNTVSVLHQWILGVFVFNWISFYIKEFLQFNWFLWLQLGTFNKYYCSDIISAISSQTCYRNLFVQVLPLRLECLNRWTNTCV